VGGRGRSTHRRAALLRAGVHRRRVPVAGTYALVCSASHFLAGATSNLLIWCARAGACQCSRVCAHSALLCCCCYCRWALARHATTAPKRFLGASSPQRTRCVACVRPCKRGRAPHISLRACVCTTG